MRGRRAAVAAASDVVEHACGTRWHCLCTGYSVAVAGKQDDVVEGDVDDVMIL